MARHRKHEEHANHEAWAIPYGDLLTLLLALFVVLYSMSSVNEGKYRVLSDSLNEAFGGRPRSPSPIQVGDRAPRGGELVERQRIALIKRRSGDPGPRHSAVHEALLATNPVRALVGAAEPERYAPPDDGSAAMQKMADDVSRAMAPLIAQQLVTVRRTAQWLEIELKSDVLYASGSAQPAPAALPVLDKLAAALAPFPNLVRIEGHTDDRPIASAQFPSNWELSAARAASVARTFIANGLLPERLSVVGYAEFQPLADNTSADARARNRRVTVVVLHDPNARVPLPPEAPLPGPVAEPGADAGPAAGIEVGLPAEAQAGEARDLQVQPPMRAAPAAPPISVPPVAPAIRPGEPIR